MTYYILRGEEANALNIQNDVQQAVSQYTLWQRSKIGRDIIPSNLNKRVMDAGAYRVDITSPVYVKIEPTEVAHVGNINVTYGGLIDE